MDFNFLGCWNSYKQNILKGQLTINNRVKTIDSFLESRSLSVISDMMQSLQKIFNPKSTIVGGDNYYSVNNFSSTSMEKNIDEGFAILEKNKMPYFFTIGSHDIENTNVLKYEFYKSYANISKTNDPSVYKFGNWFMPSTYYSLYIKTNDMLNEALFVFVDTNASQSEGGFAASLIRNFP